MMSEFRKPLFVLFLSLISTMAADLSEVQVSTGNKAFTNSLYNALAKEEGDIVFSPISIHVLLSLIYQGAGGTSKEALSKSLQIEEPSQAADGYHTIISKINTIENVTLYTANKIYINSGVTLQPKFDLVAKEKFQTQVDTLDFADSISAANTINSWVNATTRGRIPTLFAPASFSSATRLVLVNAIYFKGSWQSKFDKSSTRTEPFYVDQDTEIEVQMMHKTGGYRFKEDSALGAKVIELQFTSKTVRMVIVLPNDKYGIRDLEGKVQEKGIDAILNGLGWEDNVILSLPKFRLEKSINLNEPLNEVGLGVLFSGSSNLTGLISGGEPLRVSKGIQKVFIEVNEEGAEAAAATGFTIETLSLHIPEYKEIYVNHPFLLILKEGDNILFYGKIVKPVSGDSAIAPRAQPNYYVPPRPLFRPEEISFLDY